MPRPPDLEKAEDQHAAGLNSWTKASLSNIHEANLHVRPPSPEGSSDVSRVEELQESPNPNAGIELEGGDMWVSRSESRAEYTVKSPRPLEVYHPFSPHVLSLLMAFSVFGTLARLGIHALATYPGQSVFPLAWIQAVGCGIMGFALGMRDPITLFYGPLYTAITTGFCGSLTTFSGWQLDIVQAWADINGFHRLWIYDVMDGLTRTLFTLAASLAAFGLGVHLGKRTASRVPVLSPPNPIVRWAITIVSISVYVLTIPFFVRLNHSWRPLATAALVFSFPGTLTRYILSTQLNTRFKAFPIGTLLANEFATALLAACHIIQRVPPHPSPVSCSILQGLIDGYCGCLSTVSTFAAELRTLRGKKAWAYFTITFGLGQVILLVMLGPAWWTGRVQENNMCIYG